MPMLFGLVMKNVPTHPLTEVRGVLGTFVKKYCKIFGFFVE